MFPELSTEIYFQKVRLCSQASTSLRITLTRIHEIGHGWGL